MKGIENVSLVREQHRPEVYLIVGDTKFWIVDPNEFNALGFDWNRIRVVDVVLYSLPETTTGTASLQRVWSERMCL